MTPEELRQAQQLKLIQDAFAAQMEELQEENQRLRGALKNIHMMAELEKSKAITMFAKEALEGKG